MYNILKHAHSGLRWIVLAALILAIVNAFRKMSAGKEFTPADKKVSLFALIFTHIQFLLGLGLYFVSPKVNFAAESMKEAMSRFFLVEHSLGMIIAIILITVGFSRAKRKDKAREKFKTIFWFYLIGLLLILAMIPWPPRFGAAWF